MNDGQADRQLANVDPGGGHPAESFDDGRGYDEPGDADDQASDGLTLQPGPLDFTCSMIELLTHDDRQKLFDAIRFDLAPPQTRVERRLQTAASSRRHARGDTTGNVPRGSRTPNAGLRRAPTADRANSEPSGQRVPGMVVGLQRRLRPPT